LKGLKSGTEEVKATVMRGKEEQGGRPAIGILIQDPEERSLFSELLKDKGFIVEIFEPDRISSESLSNVNLVIIDEKTATVHLNKILTLKRLKGSEFFPLVITLKDKSRAKKWLNAGVDEILTYPLDEGELLLRLNNLLRLREKTLEIYEVLIKRTDIGFYRTTPDGKILYANPALVKMLGYSSFEELSKRNLEKNGFEPDYPRSKFKEAMEKYGEVQGFISAWKTRNGKTLYVRESARAVKDESGKILYYEGTVVDITEAWKASHRIEHLNRVLMAIRGVNQLITKEKNKKRLIEKACNTLITTRGYHSAWAVLFDGKGNFLTATEAGLGKDFEPLKAMLKRGELNECIRRALAKPEVVVIENTHRECKECPLAGKEPAIRTMTVRLEYRGNLYGIISVSLPPDIMEDKEEKALFKEVAGDIAFALHDIDLEEERKETERILRENEEKYRKLFESANDAIFIMEGDKFIDCNLMAVKMFGCKTKEEVLGKTPYREFSPPLQPDGRKSEEAALERINNALKGFPQLFEWKHRRADGITFDAEISLNRIDFGRKKYILAIVRDVTAWKKAQQEIEESRAKLLKAQQVARMGFIEWDLNKNTLEFSEEIVNLFGVKPNKEWTITEFIKKIVHPEDTRIIQRNINHLRRGEKPVGAIFRAVRPDGNIIWVHAQAEVIKDKRNKPVKVLGTVVDITKLKEAEEALKKSEEKYRELVENANTIIIRMDREGRVLFFNEFAQKFFGYTEEEILGKHVVGTIVPERESTGRDLRTLLDDICKNPEKYQYNINENIKKNGERVWIAWANRVLTDNRGNPIGVLSIGTDITAQKKAEQALKESEEKYRSLVNNSPDGIFIIDFDGRLLSVNEAMTRVLGYSEEELLKMNIWDLLSKKQKALYKKRIKRLIQGESLLEPAEYEITAKDGKKYLVEIRSVPYRHKGKVIGLQGIARDITERKRMEEKLKKYFERLETLRKMDLAILETISPYKVARAAITHIKNLISCQRVSVSVFDFENKTVQVLAATGKASEPLGNGISFPITDYHNIASLREGKIRAVTNIRRLKKPYLIDLELEKQGILSYMAVPIMVEGDCIGSLNIGFSSPHRFTEEEKEIAVEIANSLGIAIHQAQIHEELEKYSRKLEDLVQERTRELEEINEELKSFVYTVSHDLKAPLRSMYGFAEALLEDYAKELPPEGREYAHRIKKAAVNMQEMIQDLLEYSRITRMEIVPKKVNLNEVIKTTIESLRSEIEAKNARIEVKSPLPAVKGNSTILGLILLNLLSNSIKFVEEGVTPEVKIWAEESKNKVRLYIKDNGIGIPEEYQKKIFKVFERLHGIESYPGTGIGLAIVKKAIERLGGKIGLVSEPGRGSTFWIELNKEK